MYLSVVPVDPDY